MDELLITDNPAVLNKPVEQSLSSSPGAKSKRCLILMNKLWMPFSIDLHPTKNVSAPEGWRAVLSQAKLRLYRAGRTIDLSQVTKIDSLHLGNLYTLSCLESFKCSALQNFVSVNFGLEEYRKAAETDKARNSNIGRGLSPEVYNRDEESKVNLVEWFTVKVDNKQILPTLKFKGDHEAFEIRPHGDKIRLYGVTDIHGDTHRINIHMQPNTPMVVIEQGATGPGIPETGSERGPPSEAKKFLQVMVSVLNGAVSMADPEGPAAQNDYLLE
ncbi:hypothetical protein C8J56DRAFT_900667 [Mycena floridula]|nr:hypothetical protein C8J56DRAFT_900667 [Mycena floridula]